MAGKNIKPVLRFAGFTDPWEQREWSDTVDISTEMVDPKRGEYDNLPHVAPGNIESFTGRVFDNVKTVKEEKLISGKFHFYVGDIVYGKINPQLGKYAYAEYEGLTSADAYVLNSKNGLDQKFLFSLIQTSDFYRYTVSVSMRSGMPKINRDELNSYTYFSPCNTEQKKIGDLFLGLDNLITLHQRKYEKLMNVKKSCLEKMFPRDGKNVPEIRFAGFTDPWEQRKLSEVVYRVSAMSEEIGLPRVEYEDINSGQGTLNKNIYEKNSTKQGVLFHENDVLFGKLRPYLKNWLLAGFSGIAVGDFWVLRGDETDSSFVYSLIQSSAFDEVANQSSGTKMPRSDWNLVSNTVFSIPYSKGEQHQIGAFSIQLDNLITLHQRELTKLQNIKKACLEKMFV